MIAALMIFLSGCAVTDIDRKADFSRLRSFGWGKSEVEVSNPVYNSELVDKRMKAVVADEFNKLGIVRNEENPDFLVNYYTYTEKKEEKAGYNRPYPFFGYGFGYFPYSFYRHPWSWGLPYMGGSYYQERSFTEGTLVLDIVDTRAGEVVWRGSVSGNVDNLKGLQKQIEKGVRAILKKYPGRPSDNRNVLPPDDVVG